MEVVKLSVLTLLVLEILAFLVHFEELINYIGNAFVAVMPFFVIIVIIIWMVRAIIR